MKLVVGGAGFIGSHLVAALAARGETVRVLDNLSTGQKSFLSEALHRRTVTFQKGDLFRIKDVRRALKDVDEVYHLAADPDVRLGLRRPWSTFRDGAVATFRVLDALRRSSANRVVYSSSSVVYGEAKRLPTPEDYGPLLPISSYGASKLAGEALVSAFSGSYGLQAWIFRFGNVVGPRLTHGVVFDFAQKLQRDPTRLQVLGDGNQDKAYLSTSDCVQGMLHGVARARDPINVLNLASRTTVRVRRIAELVIAASGRTGVRVEFTGGDRGWAGDVPRMALDVSKMAQLGWTPRHGSEEAVRMAAEWMLAPGSLARPVGARGPTRVK